MTPVVMGGNVLKPKRNMHQTECHASAKITEMIDEQKVEINVVNKQTNKQKKHTFYN